MRISPTKVAQLVEGRAPVVVILDESTGSEISFDIRELGALNGIINILGPQLAKASLDHNPELLDEVVDEIAGAIKDTIMQGIQNAHRAQKSRNN